MAEIRLRHGKTLPCAYRVNTDSNAPPRLSTRSLRGPEIEIQHFTLDHAQLGLTKQLPVQDTFIATVSLTGVSQYEMWSKGNLITKDGFAPNSLRIANLSDELQIRLNQPYEAIDFLVSRASLDALTDAEGKRRIQNLSCRWGIVDPAMTHLSRSLLPFFARPLEACALFVDHVGLAAAAHLVDYYGDTSPPAATANSFLTPIQTRRVQEMLVSNLKGNLLTADIAKECGISSSYLIRAFKKTTGYTPHQRLQRLRVDRAKDMLKNTKLPIRDIAIQCGFADQSHLTRIFHALERTTPAIWRKQNRS